ncbi:MAG: hypothetical protein S4CHLAM6_16010 [Chlamydiae bacterium]|nr:hypothetical protein [Chlamydiota bacterium]
MSTPVNALLSWQAAVVEEAMHTSFREPGGIKWYEASFRSSEDKSVMISFGPPNCLDESSLSDILICGPGKSGDHELSQYFRLAQVKSASASRLESIDTQVSRFLITLNPEPSDENPLVEYFQSAVYTGISDHNKTKED